MNMGKAGSKTMLEASPAQPIIESFVSAEKDTLHEHVNVPHDIDDPYAPTLAENADLHVVVTRQIIPEPHAYASRAEA